MKTICKTQELSIKQNLKTAIERLEALVTTLFASKPLHFYAIIYLLTGGIYMLFGGTTDDTMELMITLCLFCLEMSHALLHAKVLFALGIMATEMDYEDNRSYFTMDSLSCVVSYLCLRSFSPDFTVSRIAAIALLLDVIIHVYFVIMWKSGTEALTVIKQWSSMPILERFLFVSTYNNLRFFSGTALDTSVHIYLAWNLYDQFKTILAKLSAEHLQKHQL